MKTCVFTVCFTGWLFTGCQRGNCALTQCHIKPSGYIYSLFVYCQKHSGPATQLDKFLILIANHQPAALVSTQFNPVEPAAYLQAAHLACIRSTTQTAIDLDAGGLQKQQQQPR